MQKLDEETTMEYNLETNQDLKTAESASSQRSVVWFTDSDRNQLQTESNCLDANKIHNSRVLRRAKLNSQRGSGEKSGEESAGPSMVVK